MPTHICFTFDKIKCLDPKSNGNGDDIYIKVAIDGGFEKRYPDHGTFADNMKAGDETPPLNIPIKFAETAFVQLMEQDTLGDDSLGALTYTPNYLPPQNLVLGSESTYEFYIKDINVDC